MDEPKLTQTSLCALTAAQITIFSFDAFIATGIGLSQVVDWIIPNPIGVIGNTLFCPLGLNLIALYICLGIYYGFLFRRMGPRIQVYTVILTLFCSLYMMGLLIFLIINIVSPMADPCTQEKQICTYKIVVDSVVFVLAVLQLPVPIHFSVHCFKHPELDDMQGETEFQDETDSQEDTELFQDETDFLHEIAIQDEVNMPPGGNDYMNMYNWTTHNPLIY